MRMTAPPAIAFTLTILVHAAPALATVYLPADFAEMVDASIYIVHGSVADVRSEAIADRRSIVTYVTVDVTQQLKGSLRESLTFVVPGGQVGHYERIVVGAPRFEPGDEVVLFLTARGPTVPYLFGLSQGVYRVSRATGRALVTPPAVLAREADGAASGRVVRGDPARRPLGLDEFARHVRAAMERRK